jgi:hypothetical protein
MIGTFSIKLTCRGFDSLLMHAICTLSFSFFQIPMRCEFKVCAVNAQPSNNFKFKGMQITHDE